MFNESTNTKIQCADLLRCESPDPPGEPLAAGGGTADRQKADGAAGFGRDRSGPPEPNGLQVVGPLPPCKTVMQAISSAKSAHGKLPKI